MTRPSKREVERSIEKLGDGDDGETMPPPQIVYTTDVDDEYESEDGEPVEIDPDRFTIVLDGDYVPNDGPIPGAGDADE